LRQVYKRPPISLKVNKFFRAWRLADRDVYNAMRITEYWHFGVGMYRIHKRNAVDPVIKIGGRIQMRVRAAIVPPFPKKFVKWGCQHNY